MEEYNRVKYTLDTSQDIKECIIDERKAHAKNTVFKNYIRNATCL